MVTSRTLLNCKYLHVRREDRPLYRICNSISREEKSCEAFLEAQEMKKISALFYREALSEEELHTFSQL